MEIYQFIAGNTSALSHNWLLDNSLDDSLDTGPLDWHSFGHFVTVWHSFDTEFGRQPDNGKSCPPRQIHNNATPPLLCAKNTCSLRPKAMEQPTIDIPLNDNNFLAVGLRVAGYKPRKKFSYRTQIRRFREAYGISPKVARAIWCDLRTAFTFNSTVRGIHFFFGPRHPRQ